MAQSCDAGLQELRAERGAEGAEDGDFEAVLLRARWQSFPATRRDQEFDGLISHHHYHR